MARFDRRTNYPLQNPSDSSVTGLATDASADLALVPVKVGGVIKTVGAGRVPINRLAPTLKNPYLYKISWAKFTKGSGPRSWGSRLL